MNHQALFASGAGILPARFKATMCDFEIVEAFHEPALGDTAVSKTSRSASQHSGLLRLVPLCPAHGRAPCANRSMVPCEMVAMHNSRIIKAPHEQRLEEKDIHVWTAGLDQSPERISAFKETLAPDELSRAGRFHFERDRNRFIAGRGVLREILGSYLEARPGQLHFDYSPRGKPMLKASSARLPLHFNLGHSEGLILIALTKSCPVGIDLEWVHPIPELEDIARQYFSTREATDLMALSKDRQLYAFYQLWTRKEACLKATGEGLSGSMRETEAPASWTLVELAPTPEFVAAVAAPAADLTVSCRQWPA